MLNAAKAGQGRVIAGTKPVFQVGKNLLLKPVVVNPVKAPHIRPAAKAPLIRPVTTNAAKVGPIKPGLTTPAQAQPSGPLKAGLIRPGSSQSAPVQGLKRPHLS